MKKLFLATVAAVVAGALAYWLLTGEEHPKATAESPSSSTETAATEVSSAASNSAPSTITTSATATSSALTTPEISRSSPPPAPGKAPSAEDFARVIEKAQTALPTLEKMRALPPKDVEHGTPAALINAGAELGEVADAIEKNPALAARGMEFYAQCARRADLAGAARALCLANLRELAGKQGTSIDEKGISPEIVKLADQLKENK